MSIAPRRCRVDTLTAVVVCTLALCPNAAALDPGLDISQYAHTSWKISDGFTRGLIKAVAQTPDGYLWLGTEFGLLRFDGVRAVEWQPPAGQSLPSNDIWSVLAGSDGSLWIGTAKGLARWKDRRLTHYHQVAGRIVWSMLEDREQTVWVSATSVPTGRLCAIRDRDVTCFGDDGRFAYGILGLHEDRQGGLWLGAAGGFWRWRPGTPRFFPIPGQNDVTQGFAEDRDGALLVLTRSGIKRFVAERVESPPLTGPTQPLDADRVLRDRDGGLWIATNRGLVHVHDGRTDTYTEVDGLSGDNVDNIFEDREGSIWVTTTGGLDRFRDAVVWPVSEKQGLTNRAANSVRAAADGSVWIATPDSLDLWRTDGVTSYRSRARSAPGEVARQIVVDGFPPGVAVVLPDDRGRTWVASPAAFGYLDGERFTRMPAVTARAIRSMVADSGGSIWISDQQAGLLRVASSGTVERTPWPALGRKDFATAMLADRSRGGVWLGFWDGGLGRVVDGRMQERYGPAQRLGGGRVSNLSLDADGSLWATTQGGLSRIHGGNVVTLTSRNGLPCDDVHWAVADDRGSLWVSGTCGLARIARSDVDAWLADSRRVVTSTLFDSSDGVRAQAMPTGYEPFATKARDGKLWFVGLDGLRIVDPGRLPFNSLEPPVHVERIIADRAPFDALATGVSRVDLPALTRDLQIDYTALSLAAPEKVLFRYRLEGFDVDWQDVGTRRQAFYNNLSPGQYRFRVIASNNSGVWNETGATLDFSIAPAYYQTAWFRLAILGVGLALFAGLHRLRLKQVAAYYNARLDARVAERTRIARDLHDTLLQSFQGVLLKFHAATFLLPDRPDEARRTLEAVVDQARGAITEGRDAVQGLRASVLTTNDLADAITLFGDALAAEQPVARRVGLRVDVEGRARTLAPIVQDDIYRIVCEALRNAVRHAGAARVEVEVHYDHRHLRVRVRDDGRGIDDAVLKEGGRPGHHGLQGMHERASLLGGTLTIWSQVDSGTEVEITVPGSVAYAK